MYIDERLLKILETHKGETADVNFIISLIKTITKEYETEQLRIANVSKRFSSAEKMAEWLHNNYEEIALNNGWKTQEDCQVPFCNLPKENKETMIELCERFLNVC